MKNSLEHGHVGEQCAPSSASVRLYPGWRKRARLASNPQCAERFLSFPGAREISEHPR